MSVYNRFTSKDVFITKEITKSNIWSSGEESINTDLLDVNSVFSSVINSDPFHINFLFSKKFQEENGDFLPDYLDKDTIFSIAYGHRRGHGSPAYNDDNAQPLWDEYRTDAVLDSPSRSVYNQYRSLVYGDETKDFSFSGHTPDNIFIINFSRMGYKQSLATGSMELTFSDQEDSSDTIVLTDDSVTNPFFRTSLIGREYNIVSGSNGVSHSNNIAIQSQLAHNPLNNRPSGSFGLFYPDAGILIFNGDALLNSSAFPFDQIQTIDYSSAGPDYAADFSFQSTNLSRFQAGIVNGRSFKLQSEEELNAVYYNIDIPNTEFNYSNSKTFRDKNNNVRINSMVDNPRVYITTIGLYNDNDELLAVAKVSKPIAKDFTKSLLLKVKLTF